MTLREFFDSFASSPAATFLLDVPPTTPPSRASIEIRIDNPHGVPADYTLARLRRSGLPLTTVDVTERRVGIPTRRTMQLPLDEATSRDDHLITICAGGRTSKLVLYRESLAERLAMGTSPDVSVAIAATGAVRFSVNRPDRRHGAA
jgi:hypothetical protein